MKKTKCLSIVMAAVLTVALVFTGCSSKTGETTKTTGTKDDVTLTFYGFADWVSTEPFKAAYDEAKAKFETENPGYIIELQSDAYGDWEQKYKTMFASGSPADIFIIGNPDVPTFANSENLLDMGQYVETGYFDEFFPGVLDMYKWQGKNMAIPFTTDCRVLWMNKNIFKEAGLDPAKPPKTWEEMKEYALQITEKTGKYGYGMDLGLKQFPMESAFCASNGTTIKVAEDGTITPNVNTPEFKAYLQLLVDMKPSFEPDYANLNHHDVEKQFTEEQFGMIIGNTLLATDIYSKDFYAHALVPKMDESAPNGSFGGGFGIAVSNKTKAPEQAVKFAQMLCSPEFNARLISDIPASNKGVAESTFASDENLSVFMEQIQYARQAQPKTLYFADIDAATYDAVVEVVVGGKSIDSVVADLEKKIIDIVKE